MCQTARNNTKLHEDFCALQNHVQGGYNTAVGYNALADNITGVNNTAVGYNAAGSENSSYKLYISANSSFVGTSALIYGDDGGEDGSGEGYKPFKTLGTWSARDDVGDGNPVALENIDLIVPDQDFIVKQEWTEGFWTELLRK